MFGGWVCRLVCIGRLQTAGPAIRNHGRVTGRIQALQGLGFANDGPGLPLQGIAHKVVAVDPVPGQGRKEIAGRGQSTVGHSAADGNGRQMARRGRTR